MTIIIALKDKNRIYMGADRLVCRGFVYTNPEDGVSKIVKRGDFIYGISGLARCLSVLQYNWREPRIYKNEDSDEYIHTRYLQELIACLESNNVIQNESGMKSMQEGEFLLGFSGNIYRIASDFYVCKHSSYVVGGSGVYHGKAALDILSKNSKIGPEEKIRRAIKVASDNVMNVNNQIDIDYVEYSEG